MLNNTASDADFGDVDDKSVAVTVRSYVDVVSRSRGDVKVTLPYCVTENLLSSLPVVIENFIRPSSPPSLSVAATC